MAIDDKLYALAGSALFEGSYKARFANDRKTRLKMLERAGNSEIVLVDLPEPMTKIDAIAYLKANTPEGVNLQAIEEKETAIVAANTPKVPKVKAIKVPKEKKVATPKVKAVKTPKVESETPSESSTLVNTIVNSARASKAGSIRAKAIAHSSKISNRIAVEAAK